VCWHRCRSRQAAYVGPSWSGRFPSCSRPRGIDDRLGDASIEPIAGARRLLRPASDRPGPDPAFMSGRASPRNAPRPSYARGQQNTRDYRQQRQPSWRRSWRGAGKRWSSRPCFPRGARRWGHRADAGRSHPGRAGCPVCRRVAGTHHRTSLTGHPAPHGAGMLPKAGAVPMMFPPTRRSGS
jgi:hypothetical protein